MILMDKNNKKKKVVRHDSVLEALRDIGQSSVSSMKRDLIQKVPEDAADMLFRPKRFQGELKPNESVDVVSREAEIRREYERKLRQQEQLRRQEFEVFSARKQTEKKKIEALQAEVIELAKSIEKFDREVKTAAIQQTVNPGVYHETFFEKLASFIKSLSKKVNNASEWLAATNKRAKRQPFYWRQVKKSGTKFMLSQERYMATQAG